MSCGRGYQCAGGGRAEGCGRHFARLLDFDRHFVRGRQIEDPPPHCRTDAELRADGLRLEGGLWRATGGEED